MDKVEYGVVLGLALVVGLIGGIVSGPLGEHILPQKLLPKYMRARSGFEIIDKHGKLHVRLDKEGLAFFGEDGEQITALSPHGVSFVFNDPHLYRSLQISPTNPCIVSFTQHTPRGVGAASFGAEVLQPGRVPKLGCGMKDGKVMWEVP